MARLEYFGDQTLAELAERWGVHFTTLKEDASEASRINRILFESDDELRTSMLGALRAIAARCIKVEGAGKGGNRGNPSAPHQQVAINAIRAIADINGLTSKKHEDQHAPLPVVSSDSLRRMAEAYLRKREP